MASAASRHSWLAVATLFVLAAAALVSPSPAATLELKVFAAEANGFGVTSTVIYGPTEAVLVDAQFRNPDAARLADMIEKLGRRLTAIVISHPHGDHFVGLALLHERFPTARIYMSAAGLEVYQKEVDDILGQYRSYGPKAAGLAPAAEPTPEPFPKHPLSVDGEVVEVLQNMQGDYADRPINSAVWVPSLKALVASDLVFDEVHVWLEKSSVEGRLAWRKTLAKLATLKPSLVVAGHKRDVNSPNDPAALAATQRYLEVFEERRAAAANADALIKDMQERYPTWAHPLFLNLAAKSAFEHPA